MYEAAIRYVAAHYRSTRWNPDPAGLCVAVGRRERQALAQSQRNDAWDPPPALMARLGRVRPEVLPISACGRNRQAQEVRLDTREVVLSVGVAYPEWSTPNLASVRVTIRESPRDRSRYTCSVLRGLEGWYVRSCV